MEDSGYQVTYNSDQGGMSVIYDITNIFLDPVIKNNFFPEGFLSEKGYDRVDSDWANMPQDMLDNMKQSALNVCCIQRPLPKQLRCHTSKN